jgi:signal transduction histidine kinase/DNA-binding response OmpR family regulator
MKAPNSSCQPLSADRAQLLFQFVEHAPAAIALLDQQMQYLLVSRQWSIEYATPDSPLIGCSHYDRFPLFYANPTALERWQIAQASCLEGNVESCDRELFLHTDGRKDWLKWEMRPWYTEAGDVGGCTLMVESIAAQKQALETLQEAKEAAESADRAKSLFLANMSHELRTPLNAILGYSEILEEEAADCGYTEMVGDLEKIRSAGKHLLAIINNILDLSKIEAGRMEVYIEPFDIAHLVAEVRDTIQPMVVKNNNALTVKLEPDLGTMRSDLTKVRQSLLNLLSNAAKFTDRGQIVLNVRRDATPAELGTPRRLSAPDETSRQRNWVTFEVSDTGIGMSPQQLETVFNPFSQAEASTTRQYGGTGLGLAIVRHFCQMMGGFIHVDSQVGDGSTFTICLPIEPPGETFTNDMPSLEGTLSNLREWKKKPLTVELSLPAPIRTVLAIDDDPTVLDLIARRLTKEGLQVYTAPTGQEGLHLAKVLHPDAIILDVLMQDMNGWAVLSTLKADPELADVPVIMATILDEKNVGFTLGAADYISKPVDNQCLTRLLNKFQRGLAQDSSSHTILVVEDDPLEREMLLRILETQGWAAVAVENGRAAIERISQQPPDLILLDLLLPQMDGFEFLDRLRQMGSTVPTIAITALDLTSADLQRLDGYVQQVLQKGTYSRDELLQHVQYLLRGQPSEVNDVRE